MEAAIAAAGAANALVVVSAGNSARDIDAKPVLSRPRSRRRTSSASPRPRPTRDATSTATRTTAGWPSASPRPAGRSWRRPTTAATARKSGTSMAAPIVAGVAAMMVALNPGLSASELRARLLQHAGRSRLPVAAGYVDALESVRSVTTAVGQESTQRAAPADPARDGRPAPDAGAGGRQRLDAGHQALRHPARPQSRASVTARRSTFTVALQRRGQARPDRRARRGGAQARDRHAPRRPAARGQARRHPRARGRDVIEALLVAAALAATPATVARGGSTGAPARRSRRSRSAARPPRCPSSPTWPTSTAAPRPTRRASRSSAAGRRPGITDAARGITSAGMVSRDLTAQDPPGLVLTPIALSGVCLVTNRANPVPGHEPRAGAGARRRAHHELVAGARLAAPRRDRAGRARSHHGRAQRLRVGLRRRRDAARLHAPDVPHRRPGARTSSRPRRPPGATSTSPSPTACTRCATTAWPASAPRSAPAPIRRAGRSAS